MALLTFLHTNDIHGRLPELARLTTVARREQAQAERQGRTVFRWDAGDAFDWRYEECHLTRGEALPPVLSAAGVTLQTLGNDIGIHYGLSALTRMAQRATYPILAANLRNGAGAVVKGVQQSVLLRGSYGLNLGVFGLTPTYRGPHRIDRPQTPDATEVAQQMVMQLREAGADMVILLSHSGLREDRELAQHVPGLNLIIGGHSHSLLPEGEWINGKMIAQAGCYAEYLGRVDVDVDATGNIRRRVASVIPIPPDTLPDPEVMRALEDLEHELQGIRPQVVGHLSAPLPLRHFEDSPAANFAAWALRVRAGAEVGLVASGALHQPFTSTTVTRVELANAALVPVNALVSEVRGDALHRALECSLDPAVVSPRVNGLRGTPVGVLGLSGVQVTVKPGAPVGQRAAQVLVNGEPLDRQREYIVAHTDLETGEERFLHGSGIQEMQSEYTVLLEDVLRDHLQLKPVTAAEFAPAWLGLEHLDLHPHSNQT